ELKKKLIELLAKPYDILPPKFPKDIGTLFYNEDFNSLPKKYPDIFSTKLSKEILEILLKKKEDWLPKFQSITDRAIRGERPKEEDKSRIEKAFSKIKVYEEQKNGRWMPIILQKEELPENLFDLLFQWVYYIWKGIIRVKRCEADKCNKIFIPYPNAPIEQKYCSDRCKNRMAKRRYRQRQRL
ncbi:MAG TPA: CGNR zinc finger domain-containing protein, partial [Candidatus Omnitrophica bacterium]|nr:CGNR zinc finger domain-containing protein [Candidatus Omnitrophota bacterium]